MPKNAFFGLFFQNFACGAKNLAKIGTKRCFGRARKINLVDLKKRPSKFSKIFWKPTPPPLEKILDPSLTPTIFLIDLVEFYYAAKYLQFIFLAIFFFKKNLVKPTLIRFTLKHCGLYWKIFFSVLYLLKSLFKFISTCRFSVRNTLCLIMRIHQRSLTVFIVDCVTSMKLS